MIQILISLLGWSVLVKFDWKHGVFRARVDSKRSHVFKYLPR